jgi:hypothetical protein
MFNNHWSLRYLIPSTNFKEDKRAKPFYLDEEEEEEKKKMMMMMWWSNL